MKILVYSLILTGLLSAGLPRAATAALPGSCLPGLEKLDGIGAPQPSQDRSETVESIISIYKRAAAEGEKFSFRQSDINDTLSWLVSNVTEFTRVLKDKDPGESVEGFTNSGFNWARRRVEVRQILPLLESLNRGLEVLQKRDRVDYGLYLTMVDIYAHLMSFRDPVSGGLFNGGLQGLAKFPLIGEYTIDFDKELTKILDGADISKTQLALFYEEIRPNDYFKKPPYGFFLPLIKPLTIEDFNDLSPYPIWILGLTKTIEYADGLPLAPLEFFMHDLNHGNYLAQSFKKVIDRVWYRVKGNMPAFIAEREARYSKLTNDLNQDASLTDLDRRTIRLCWFFVTHELANADDIHGLNRPQDRVDDILARINSPRNDLGFYFPDGKPDQQTLLKAFHWIQIHAP